MVKYVFVCMNCGDEYYEHEILKIDNKRTIELMCPSCRCESIEVYIEKEAI